MTGVCVLFHGQSRSFERDALPIPGLVSVHESEVIILAGSDAGRALKDTDTTEKRAILVELGTECLGVWTGESRGLEGSNVLGFSRFRLGNRPASDLVEIVRQPGTSEDATAAAREVFESAGLRTAVCNDTPGRIVDRLARPYLNSALQALDEQLASADDLDLTVRLGLSYPEGPISLLEDSGLAAHFEVSQALYRALGEPALLPARRARVAWLRDQAAETTTVPVRDE
jgi:3-hydroxybutyryl-CoA dehydrogenase